MGRKKNKSADVTPANVGTPVAESEIINIADAGEDTPQAESKVEKANPILGIPSDVPSVWVKPEDVLVEFDTRTIPNSDQAKTDLEFAVSIAIYGQKQPAIGYYDDVDGRLNLTTGRTRRRAIKLLNEGFTAVDPRNGETVEFKDANRRLWVAIEKQRSKEDQFVHDLTTQIVSNALSPVQEAYAVKKLTETWGWSLTDAAKLFGYNNTNRASRLVRLLTLEEAVINAVHNDKLSLDAAISTADLKPAERLKIIAKATDDDSGEVNGGLIKELLRDVYSQGDEAVKVATGRGGDTGGDDGDTDEKSGGRPAGPSLARNVSHFKRFVAEHTADESEHDIGEPAKELLKAFEKWFGGVRFGDVALRNALERFTKSKLPTATKPSAS